MAKVSLIVPIYNTEKYLKKCLDSLINQSLKDIEIILVNDGSTDNSEEIVKSYNDKRIVYISKDNEGIGKTRNLGIEKATGDYLAFVDSDDYLHENFCEKMYNKAISENCDLVICDYYEDNENIKEIKFIDFANTSLHNNPNLINNINLGPCNKLYSRKLFINKENRFVENLKYEDAPLVVKLLLEANSIGKVNECLTYYVIHNNSQTTVRDEKIFDILKITELINKELDNNNFNHDAKVNLLVMILTDYTIQQRYVNDKILRNKFINEAFNYLDNIDKYWRKCNYLKRFSIIKRIIKSNKLLTKIYCKLYVIKHK